VPIHRGLVRQNATVLDIFGDIVGAVLGGGSGRAVRRSYFGRRLKRAQSGADISVRIRAHPEGAPEWKYWRGRLIRRGAALSFTPLLRRWRGFDLGDVAVAGWRTQRSIADGDSVLFELVGASKCDQLAANVDWARVAEVLLPDAYG
jgi:hypothetical protein